MVKSSSGIAIAERKYAFNIREETSKGGYEQIGTPTNPNVKLARGHERFLKEPGRYQRLAGKLSYHTITPDISFDVTVVKTISPSSL